MHMAAALLFTVQVVQFVVTHRYGTFGTFLEWNVSHLVDDDMEVNRMYPPSNASELHDACPQHPSLQ